MRNVESLKIYLLLFLLLLLNCSDEGTNPDDVEFIIPESNISFVEHILPMFELRCGLDSGCHSPQDDGNRLLYVELTNNHSLQDHKLISGESLVDLNKHLAHPEFAPLYLILAEGFPSSENRMPPYLTKLPLTDDQIDGVRRWIGEGAKD